MTCGAVFQSRAAPNKGCSFQGICAAGGERAGPAASAHNLAAADVPKTTTTPAGRVCRAAAACTPRRVSPPLRRKKVRSFSPATCAAEKIPLGLQTHALFASGGHRVRCSQAAIPRQKSNTFLIATTPQALARGVSAQLVQKPRRVSPPERRKKVSIIFSGDMCGGENTARPANVRAVHLRRTVRALQQAANPFVKKVLLF